MVTEPRWVGRNQTLRISAGIAKLAKYIEDNPEADLSLRAAECICHLSRYHLCRKFRAEVGMSFSKYRTIKRLTAASELLKRDISLSVTDVCYMCGFGDLSNFLRAFKKHFRCTPKSFRARVTSG